MITCLAVLGLLLPQTKPDPDPLVFEIRRLQAQVAALGAELTQREEGMRALREQLGGLKDELRGLRERLAPSMAGPFLSGPPASSDSAGVAKVAVFAPRLEIDSSRRHDVLSLKVRRIEPTSSRGVAEIEMGTDQTSIDVPLDQSGALYSVEWSTSEGHSYSLVLKDGATGLPAATVQVKPLQAQGRFLFVGYRID